MLASLATDLLKHILSQEDWVYKRLQQYNGKTAHIRIPPILELKLVVLETGELSLTDEHSKTETETETENETKLTILPALLPRLLMRNESSYEHIDISGDKEFAAELITIGKHLKPYLEHELSKLFGDIPAHRITQAGNNLFQWHTNLLHNLSESLAEYWLEEHQLVIKSHAISSAANHIKVLQDDVDQLEIRINRILKSNHLDTAC